MKFLEVSLLTRKIISTMEYQWKKDAVNATNMSQSLHFKPSFTRSSLAIVEIREQIRAKLRVFLKL